MITFTKEWTEKQALFLPPQMTKYHSVWHRLYHTFPTGVQSCFDRLPLVAPLESGHPPITCHRLLHMGGLRSHYSSESRFPVLTLKHAAIQPLSDSAVFCQVIQN
jgi:hypothetical protein